MTTSRRVKTYGLLLPPLALWLRLRTCVFSRRRRPARSFHATMGLVPCCTVSGFYCLLRVQRVLRTPTQSLQIHTPLTAALAPEVRSPSVFDGRQNNPNFDDDVRLPFRGDGDGKKHLWVISVLAHFKTENSNLFYAPYMHCTLLHISM